MTPPLPTVETSEAPVADEALTTPTACDQVRTLLMHSGPYTSVYLATRPLLRHAWSDLGRRWKAVRADLESRCAPAPALAAIEARLMQPMPEDTAAIAVIAAADGASIVDYALEPPRRDFATVETLPYLAPLFEWEQRRVPHLTVSAVPGGADVISFTGDLTADITTVSGPPEVVAAETARLASEIGAKVVVVGGDASADVLSTHIRLRVDPAIRVEHESGGIDEFAEATVRHAAGATARETVGWFRELRFERVHDDVVDGTPDVIAAITEGRAGTLLIHDDPDDPRRVWVGSDPRQLAISADPRLTSDARLVDAVICATVLNGGSVHIVPSTGANGPTDDAALVRRRHPAARTDATPLGSS